MVDGHILAIVNCSGVNIHVHIPVFNLGSIDLGVELLWHGNSVFMYIFLRNCQLFSTVTFPSAMYKNCSFSMSSQHLVFKKNNNSQPRECEVVFLVWF